MKSLIVTDRFFYFIYFGEQVDEFVRELVDKNIKSKGKTPQQQFMATHADHIIYKKN